MDGSTDRCHGEVLLSAVAKARRKNEWNPRKRKAFSRAGMLREHHHRHSNRCLSRSPETRAEPRCYDVSGVSLGHTCHSTASAGPALQSEALKTNGKGQCSTERVKYRTV
ncbi:hypothetical protein AOLI_G00313690 [Acnodon oligacanthus]